MTEGKRKIGLGNLGTILALVIMCVVQIGRAHV